MSIIVAPGHSVHFQEDAPLLSQSRIPWVMQRVVTLELLDEDLGSPQEITSSLADLRRVNRWFGGVRTTVDMVQRVAQRTGKRSFSLLDVAAGSGGMSVDVQLALARRGLQIETTLLDRKESHLRQDLPDGSPALQLRRIAADALALPFSDSSFDLVACTLFAHHLEPGELIRFLREALRVCRVAVLINDLRRSSVSLALVYAGFPIFRSRLSRHDGVASVRRAYTAREMRSMLAHTTAPSELRHHFLFRMGVIAWKRWQ